METGGVTIGSGKATLILSQRFSENVPPGSVNCETFEFFE